MGPGDWKNILRRLADLERLVRRITQLESKPRIIVGPSSGNATLYRFTLNESWTAGVADADILEMDGTDTGIDDDVLDPLGIFDTLGIGDAGLCLLQNGKYYVIQAPCPAV